MDKCNPDQSPPSGPQRPRRPGVCRACGRARTIYRRGLCWGCYDRTETRAAFPSQFRGGDPFNPDTDAPKPPSGLAHLPTAHPPGSPGKLEILAERVALRLPLHLPGDARRDA